ncbi:MAG: glycosyltransferase [Flavobacteriales bacterium]|nr:glycosyltransferase [Flavobacteriales bacterium]MCB9364767.1 glycosyltransferase [Flavobacteriales bacterium]
MNNNPKISIITVVYNNKLHIENTILSVLNQTYKNIEYIIIDGNSSDGTLEIIKKYIDNLGCLISEQDNGIYDAMNKGLLKASGEWIYFLNSGDTFYSNDTLHNIFSSESFDKADLIYGNHESNYGYFKRIHTPKALSHLWKGMIFSHQGMFVKTNLMKVNPFDLSFKISADYNFIYNLYKQNKTFKHINIIIATLEAGGLSEININKTHIERWKIIRNYEHSFYHNLVYLIELFKIYIIQIIKFIFPNSLVRLFTKLKYKL